MKISVITVSYNACTRIERTIKSVISQDFADYEYVIIDGNSCDGTIDIVEKYLNDISVFITEPDTGIYNAMNKGVKYAKGDFCIFMNAGDMFCNDKVLSNVAKHLDDSHSIIMGNQVYLKPSGAFSSYGKYWKEITEYRLFYDSLYHQASFIRRIDLLETPFDETLKMVSDWKLALSLLLVQRKKYKGIDVDVDFFYEDGITSIQKDLGAKERQLVLDEFFTLEQQNLYLKKRLAYKSFFNVKRYLNFIFRTVYQFYKQISICTPR